MNTVNLTFPVRTVNETNAHEHWRSRQRRAKAQRTLAYALTRRLASNPEWNALCAEPITVTFTRVAPSEGLDCDSLPPSCKSLRDGIADAINGGQDRTPRIAWRYEQLRGPKGHYEVKVSITTKGVG